MTSMTPIFREIVDSSLWSEPPHVRVLFMTMLALKDADHVVRIEMHHLPRKAVLEPDQVVEALHILESPDEKWGGLDQEYQGRRLKRVEEGWLVLNGEKYQQRMRKLFERARWARAQSAKRERDRQKKGVAA